MQLLQFRIDAGYETLEKHFSSMAGNAKYTSPSFQNEILAIAGSMLVQEIVAEANETCATNNVCTSGHLTTSRQP